MEKYHDLEASILSCLLLKSENMKDLRLEDKHFVKHKRIWLFMKQFYAKFESFDIVLMYSVAKDKYQIVEAVKYLLNIEASANIFGKYQDQLIDLYNEEKKDKYKREQIYILANDLIIKSITIDEFDEKYKKLNDNADQIFIESKGEENE